MKTQPNDPPEGTDYWKDEHPDHPLAGWRYEVANGDTRLGYWEWVKKQTGEIES